MKFWKKREKSNENPIWRYTKLTAVVVCVIGIGISSINVIPTGYTGVKSTFGKISEKEGGMNKTVVNDEPKIGRNDPCPCGSGKKYKNCCGK